MVNVKELFKATNVIIIHREEKVNTPFDKILFVSVIIENTELKESFEQKAYVYSPSKTAGLEVYSSLKDAMFQKNCIHKIEKGSLKGGNTAKSGMVLFSQFDLSKLWN